MMEMVSSGYTFQRKKWTTVEEDEMFLLCSSVEKI